MAVAHGIIAVPRGELGCHARRQEGPGLPRTPVFLHPFLPIGSLPSPLTSVVPGSARSWKSQFWDQADENATGPGLVCRRV